MNERREFVGIIKVVRHACTYRSAMPNVNITVLSLYWTRYVDTAADSLSKDKETSETL